jgi:hypothetical protein
MRLNLTIVFMAVLLAAFGLHAQPAHAQAWTKIDCSGAHLLAPPGVQAECNQGPEDMGGTASCHYFRYSITVPANVREPRFYVQLRQSQNVRCGLAFSASPENTMKRAAKFVEDEATNWSALQALDPDTNVMFFDAKNQKTEGKCFAFTKLGPLVNAAGRAYTMYGFFCKPPGQGLDAASAGALIGGIQVKS